MDSFQVSLVDSSGEPKLQGLATFKKDHIAFHSEKFEIISYYKKIYKVFLQQKLNIIHCKMLEKKILSIKFENRQNLIDFARKLQTFKQFFAPPPEDDEIEKESDEKPKETEVVKHSHKSKDKIKKQKSENFNKRIEEEKKKKKKQKEKIKKSKSELPKQEKQPLSTATSYESEFERRENKIENEISLDMFSSEIETLYIIKFPDDGTKNAFGEIGIGREIYQIKLPNQRILKAIYTVNTELLFHPKEPSCRLNLGDIKNSFLEFSFRNFEKRNTFSKHFLKSKKLFLEKLKAAPKKKMK
ncbi:hypothetical protein M0811_04188 [Anaeramoeba ignava]|uniref:Uncharacterized protein n=1 Tax=Anaeramoeba ignava TaxID=1746090 RepID=A0A9Q0LXW0_ANAIG|nr:hypothetical protein M0811_04188 [Anaeramoeba ignava]|eukprot:Anaeramoba_ignava/a478578_50.p1 GENE.a478578_50~~a478578_50.p1  ORF type:complete len:310 (+),score=126.62 a478578_50:32-931(+)